LNYIFPHQLRASKMPSIYQWGRSHILLDVQP
jgi:hypothetical protein